ncbi:MAG: hypothetical protein U9Q80_07805 [Bacillota bacterium]|nr:hypothetical protein [Bacillota bacterium]
MKGLFYAIYIIFSGIGKITRGFTKAVEIIKPINLIEWIILLIAIPIPFGVTALFFYKFYKKK